MEVQGDLNHVIYDSIYNHFNGIGVWDLNDLLAKIVAKLVIHDSWDNWKHTVNEALEKGTLLILRSTIHGGLDHLLKHSASTLVEAIEVEVV